MSPRRSPLLPLAACAAALAALVAPSPALADPGRLIVRYAGGADARERAKARDGAGVVRVERLALSRTEVVAPESGTSVAEAVAELERSPDVAFAEPDAPRSAFATANDPWYAAQWALENTGHFGFGPSSFAGTADNDIDAPDAWTMATDSSAIPVAVLDTGVDLDHPDLDGNILPGIDFVADDGSSAQDEQGHGTHVAGTIGAEGNNSEGVTGVAWRSRLLPLRVLDAAGGGRVGDEVDAIVEVARRGVRVANLSLGGAGWSDAERAALQAASDTLFVVAAGNDGANNDTSGHYPCAYDLTNVLCVAWSTPEDALATKSNYGRATVDLAAPGEGILSTLPNGYGWLSGTSMATPHVAGAAALVLARRPQLTPWQVAQVLMTSADTIPAMVGKTVSGGRLNLAAALEQDAPDAGLEPTVSALGTVVTTPSTASGIPQTPTPTTLAKATPATTPAAGAGAARVDATAPGLGLALSARGALRSALAGRLRARATCTERCALRVELVVDRRTARALRLGRSAARIASGTAALARAGTANVTVRLTARAARALRGRHSVRVTVRATATDASRNRRTRSRAVTLRP